MKVSLLAVAVLAAPFTAPGPAHACGGFFCSRVPVDQAGERIAFVRTAAGVEVHVQIQYAGDAEKFAWILPVHGEPELAAGSDALFSFLEGETRPAFVLDWQPAQCGPGFPEYLPAIAGGVDAGAGFADAGSSGVFVVSQEVVGPYEAAILQATDATALRDWLTANGYDVSTLGAQAIEAYVGQGYHFVALKLQKDRSVGELRPIVLTIPGTLPCVPLRLTAVAARPNMPIVAYLFAHARGVPVNYRHVLVNQTKLDWLSSGSNYNALATEAADEAGGRAFLTEFAGSTAPLKANLGAMPGDTLDTALLATLGHPVEFMQALLAQDFPSDGAVLALVRRFIPKPASLAGTPDNAFYSFMGQYRAEIDSDPDRPPFDAAGLAKALEDEVAAPLRRARAVVTSQPYLTRLYTTMSAEEMTVDPEFDFNPDAPDVPRVHRAKATPQCNSTLWQERAVLIELADGRSFTVSRQSGPVAAGPSAARVEQYTASGPAALMRDNTALIDSVLPKPTGCGCGSAAGVAALPFALALLAALGWRRRPGAAAARPPRDRGAAGEAGRGSER